jgi:serine protease AprX
MFLSRPRFYIPIAGGLLLLVALISAGATPAARASHAQDAVWAYGDTHPGQPIPVIVQTDGSVDAAQLAVSTGAAVRVDLGFMHAAAADIPAGRLHELAVAEHVANISLDGAVLPTDGSRNSPIGADGAPTNVFTKEINAGDLWETGLLGQGVGIAVVDTGVVPSKDFGSRVVATFATQSGTSPDGYGHGSHVAGLAGSSGANSNGQYRGVAPKVNLINVKTGDDQGVAHVSDIIAGLAWVLDNKDKFNIRVVNLSLRSDTPQSYTTDPLDAAVELLTFRGILVVVAAGNTGPVADAVAYAPANDPFVLTVGAVDDLGTSDYRDDLVAPWSSRGTTQDGFAKPDVYVPGRHLVSVQSPGSVLAAQFPASVVGPYYFTLSGTSMAAGVASGGAALIFQAHPNFTPGQVKLALMQSARGVSADSTVKVAQLSRAVHLAPVDTTTSVKPNYLLLDAAGIADPQSVSWGSVSWGSISWGSISWGSISWGSVSWGSVSWGSAVGE